MLLTLFHFSVWHLVRVVCREYEIFQQDSIRNGEEKGPDFRSAWKRLMMRCLHNAGKKEESTGSEWGPSMWDDMTSALIDLSTRTRSASLGKMFVEFLGAEFHARRKRRSLASPSFESQDAFIVIGILRTLSALWSGVYRIHFSISSGWEVETTERIVSCLNVGCSFLQADILGSPLTSPLAPMNSNSDTLCTHSHTGDRIVF
jgi:hypothetical protein